jgi:hypothetical protein
VENPGLEFCVHNAHSKSDAKCYIRWYPSGTNKSKAVWVDWCDGERARDVATEIQRIEEKNEPLPRRIFRDTRYFHIFKDKVSENIDGGQLISSGVSDIGISVICQPQLSTPGLELATEVKKRYRKWEI